MGEHQVFVECTPTDEQKGSVGYWQERIKKFKAMEIPPYYPYREALVMLEKLSGELDE